MSYLEWVHAHATLIWILTGVSALSYVMTFVVAPWIIIRLPADYFLTGRVRESDDRSAVVRLLIAVARNTVGYLFVLLGIAMVVLPGQGLLTIALGLALADFPGKPLLIDRIVSQRFVRGTFRWIRVRAGKEPFLEEERHR